MEMKFLKKLTSIVAAVCVVSTMVPIVLAIEEERETRVLMNSFETENDMRNFSNLDYNCLTIEQTDDLDYVTEGDYAAKITITDTGVPWLWNYAGFHQIPGKAVVAIEMDVYSSTGITGGLYLTGETTAATGSKYMNDMMGWNKPNDNTTLIKGATVVAGEKKTLRFEFIDGGKLLQILMSNPQVGEILYIDNLTVVFAAIDAAGNVCVDSMENVEQLWGTGLYAKGSTYNISQNTDMQYVKEGTGSLKLESTVRETGGNYALWNMAYNSSQGAVKIPYYEGYTPTSFGFWVYNDTGADIRFFMGSQYQDVSKTPGWKYLAFTVNHAGGSIENYANRTIGSVIAKTYVAGTVYIDGFTVNYEEKSD